MRNPSALSTFGTSVCTTQVDRKLAAVTPRNFRRKLQNKSSFKNRKWLCVCVRACSMALWALRCIVLSSILKQIRKSVHESVHESCSVEFLQIRVWLKQECVSCTVWLLICNILTDWEMILKLLRLWLKFYSVICVTVSFYLSWL